MAAADWQATFSAMGLEIEASQAAATAAFFAAAPESEIGSAPASPSRADLIMTGSLSQADVNKLVHVVWGPGISAAIMKHIGPTSSDGSVEFGVREVGGIMQLDIRGVGSAAMLSNELPLEDGVADPGDLDSHKATAQRHIHPSADTAGGDLYFVGATAATTLAFYGNGTIGFNLDPGLQSTPSTAFNLHRQITTGGSLGPY